jgi:ubiquinol-cytochrome c reductase cytochrome b subunit
VHLVALHKVGSNNPDGVEIKDNKKDGIPVDGIPFHPYYTLKDIVGAVVFMIVFAIVMFYAPKFGDLFLEPVNFLPANPLQTPEHISPSWYMTPFYAILRAVPNKLMGVITMALAIAFMFILPWLDRSPVRSIRYKGNWSKFAITGFTICFVGLGYLGHEPVSPLYTFLARFFTVGYFAFFLLMPFYTSREQTHPVPERLT